MDAGVGAGAGVELGAGGGVVTLSTASTSAGAASTTGALAELAAGVLSVSSLDETAPAMMPSARTPAGMANRFVLNHGRSGGVTAAGGGAGIWGAGNGAGVDGGGNCCVG